MEVLQFSLPSWFPAEVYGWYAHCIATSSTTYLLLLLLLSLLYTWNWAMQHWFFSPSHRKTKKHTTISSFLVCQFCCLKCKTCRGVDFPARVRAEGRSTTVQRRRGHSSGFFFFQKYNCWSFSSTDGRFDRLRTWIFWTIKTHKTKSVSQEIICKGAGSINECFSESEPVSESELWGRFFTFRVTFLAKWD